jgi:hypothetical protein
MNTSANTSDWSHFGKILILPLLLALIVGGFFLGIWYQQNWLQLNGSPVQTPSYTKTSTSSSATGSSDTTKAQKAAQNFYNVYLSCRVGIFNTPDKYSDYNISKDSPVTYCLNKNSYATDALKNTVAFNISKVNGSAPTAAAEPIICIQNSYIPTVGTPTVNGNTATATASYPNLQAPIKIQIKLVQSNSIWKLDSITCQF